MPRKLSDEDKERIIQLYRSSGETTSTLAKLYQVSSSTISRFLKTNLSDLEYDELIQQKRMNRAVNRSESSLDSDESDKPTEKSKLPAAPRRRSRSQKKKTETPILQEKAKPQPVNTVTAAKQLNLFSGKNEDTKEDEHGPMVDVAALQELLGEDLGDLNEDEEDLEDSDEEDWEEEPLPQLSNSDFQVLPLAKATFPNICYVVIDRRAELIVRPLKEFGDLGKIPPQEVQQKTLPIFENHKVARRFSNRSQRVIKITDGGMFAKTSSHLQGKGITRLLMDGKVYSF